jgi:hypothetical protein
MGRVIMIRMAFLAGLTLALAGCAEVRQTVRDAVSSPTASAIAEGACRNSTSCTATATDGTPLPSTRREPSRSADQPWWPAP